MAITTVDKIFVDVDDEINFVVEKIIASERDRVIVVVPQNALVISSQVSCKILAKQVLQSSKQIILVTEDAFGQKLAEGAGIVFTSKISNVTPEMWEQVHLQKQRQRADHDARKQELLSERGIGSATSGKELAPVADLPAVATVELDLEETAVDKTPEAEESAVEPEQETDLDLTQTEETTDDKDSVPAAEPEIKGAIQRKRPEPKMVTIGGIPVFAGGDITMLESESPQNMATTNSGQRKPVSAEGVKPKGGFTGRDWTKYTGEPQVGNLLDRLRNRAQAQRMADIPPGERPIPTGYVGEPTSEDRERKKRKRIMIIAGVVALFLLASGYVFAFELSSVTVRVNLVTTEVPVEQIVTADTAITELTESPLSLPALQLEQKDLSVSASAQATGKGVAGDKAAGLIEIWNFTEKEVQLVEGTELTAVVPNLKYKLTQKATIPAGKKGDDDIIEPGGVKTEWRIEAAEVGEKYNLKIDNDTPRYEFQVQGYQTSQLQGFGFRSFDGGTSREVTIVSKADIENLKKRLVEEIRKQGEEQLRASLPGGFRLIAGTEVFVESAAEATPKRNEEAEDFNLSVTGNITALAVREVDLQSAIEILLTQSDDPSQQFEVTSLDDAVITDVKRTDAKVTFRIVSRGSLRSAITAEEIEQGIAGKGIGDAENYLRDIEDIDSFSVQFNPGLVPGSLRRVPYDTGRITVEIQ